MQIFGILAVAVTLVPAPREQTWRDGTCTFAEKDVRFTRDATLPPEGYRLDIATGGVTVTSADDAGAFYAMKTLRQAAIPEKDGRLACPCGTVTDAPAFRWRGFMLDEGRHFFGKETVKGLLDQMADHKLNVFHWHLTEDQGWRIDIPRYPELVKYGAVRPESPMHGCRGTKGDFRGNGQPYGPYFYTASDIREILAYAKERFITVVPEIEVPGHIRALLAAHPEFACREGLPRVPCMFNGVQDEVLCAGNDEAIRFMEQVYDEVCALFPGTYIHIGGDECPKKRWKACPKCQARIKALGLKDEDGLQAWVTRHFTDYLAKKGRRTIGWDEILAGAPGTATVVHNWRKPAYGIEAAEKGHDVVVSNVRATYFSVPQGVKDDPFTYLSPKMRCSLATAYAFDPLAGMTDKAKRHVLGAECCMWSECTWNEYDLAFKLWPRACAFAEATWTAPAAPRDFADFARRMAIHRTRLIAAGVNCAPLPETATFTVDFDIDLTDARNERLWEIPGAVTLAVREAGNDKALFAYDQAQGNYLPFKLADGTCPVIEATMACPAGRVGIPLGLLASPGGSHSVTLDFNGVYWSILVDGRHLDRDLPWKDMPEIDGAKAKTLSSRVKSARFVSPARKDAVVEMVKSRPINSPIQYWTPEGHNAWLGDVAVGQYGGRLHLFYLHDRRHHRSKDGKGGHFFAHLSSGDLMHWTEHPAAVPIVSPLESQGTGTPFVYSNNLCLAYGLHTMRFMDADKTTEPVQRRYFEEHGRDGAFRIADTPGFPAGGTYAMSFDGGETFVRSDILITRAQNPTVYNRADGHMGLVTSYGGVKGIFASDRLGDWTLVDDSIPFRGDCPCYFEWHGHAYLLQGFCRMAYNRDAKPGHFVDWTNSGDDIYDGLSVPMVAPWKGDRRIIAGWLRHLYGWGGWLCFRELVQEADGRLGMKWLPEIQPRGEVSEHRVKGGKGLSLRFRRVGGTDEMEFSVDAAGRRAQFSDCAPGQAAPRRKTIAEVFDAVPPTDWSLKTLGRNAPNGCENFAIGHLPRLDADYAVRLAKYYDAKSDATVFDAEIAGCRTMVCRRPGSYEVVR